MKKNFLIEYFDVVLFKKQKHRRKKKEKRDQKQETKRKQKRKTRRKEERKEKQRDRERESEKGGGEKRLGEKERETLRKKQEMPFLGGKLFFFY